MAEVAVVDIWIYVEEICDVKNFRVSYLVPLLPSVC
jgi:hypothetical protein